MPLIMIHNLHDNTVIYAGADEIRAIEALNIAFLRNRDIAQDEALNKTIQYILQRKFTNIPEHDVLNIRITLHDMTP